MRNTGRVLVVWHTTEMASNEPCFGVETDAADVPDTPYGRPGNSIYVPLRGQTPAIGTEITWGPHHWWVTGGSGAQLPKIGNAFNRDDPER